MNTTTAAALRFELAQLALEATTTAPYPTLDQRLEYGAGAAWDRATGEALTVVYRRQTATTSSEEGWWREPVGVYTDRGGREVQEHLGLTAKQVEAAMHAAFPADVQHVLDTVPGARVHRGWGETGLEEVVVVVSTGTVLPGTGTLHPRRLTTRLSEVAPLAQLLG